MNILALIIVGAAAGFLATRLMRVRMGTLQTVLLGVAGAVLGGLALRFLLAIAGVLAGLIGAVLGAVALIWLWQRLQARK